jgi:hypothetical protein
VADPRRQLEARLIVVNQIRALAGTSCGREYENAVAQDQSF